MCECIANVTKRKPNFDISVKGTSSNFRNDTELKTMEEEMKGFKYLAMRPVLMAIVPNRFLSASAGRTGDDIGLSLVNFPRVCVKAGVSVGLWS